MAYTVNYMCGDTTLDTQVFYGITGAKVTADSVKKVFSGYTYSSASPASVTIAADGTAMLTLNYTRNQHTVTANISPTWNETTIEGTGTKTVGEQVNLTAPEREGYIFTGWSGDFLSPSAALTFTMPDADVAVTANYAINKYSVVMDLTHITNSFSNTINHGARLAVTLTARAGYTCRRRSPSPWAARS